MSKIEDVSGTAFVVAEYRAEENREVTPIYRDPVVGLFLSDASRDAAERVASRFPPVKDMVKTRTRYFDDMLESQIADDVGQVVILGAGLDTRAVRMKAAGVRYFEIDDPSTIELKRSCYANAGIDADMALIPGNYVADGLIDLLGANGFEFDVRTYVIWEGNVMYMPLASDKQTMLQLKRHVKRFRLSFDYLTESVIRKTTGDESLTILVESFEAMGAPWLSGIDDIHSLTDDVGLRVIENVTTGDLYRRYRGHTGASPIFDHYSICTLESEGRASSDTHRANTFAPRR
jgi:methyltransferase (TIGR00027 family)